MRGSIDDRARDGRALLLAARQRDAALADHRVVARWESRRRPCRAGPRPPRPRCAAATLVSCSPPPACLSCPSCPPAPPAPLSGVEAERDVVGNRVREQERLLRHEADGAAQDRERDLADVDAVDEHRARRRIVQAREQADQRRLAGAGTTDERDGLPGLDARRDMIEDRRAVVGEDEIAEFDLAADRRLRRYRPAACSLHLRRARVRRTVSASGSPAPCRAPRASASSGAMPRCSMFVTQPNAIIGQLSIVRYALNATNSPSVMRPLITSRLPSQRTSSAPRPRKNAMLGKEEALQHDQAAVAAQVLLVRAPEALDLRRLLPVGAHDAHAGQRLLRDRADLGELRLNLLEPLVDGAAEILHRERHERQRNQRHQRQPRIDRDHHRQRRDERRGSCSPST